MEFIRSGEAARRPSGRLSQRKSSSVPHSSSGKPAKHPDFFGCTPSLDIRCKVFLSPAGLCRRLGLSDQPNPLRQNSTWEKLQHPGLQRYERGPTRLSRFLSLYTGDRLLFLFSVWIRSRKRLLRRISLTALVRRLTLRCCSSSTASPIVFTFFFGLDRGVDGLTISKPFLHILLCLFDLSQFKPMHKTSFWFEIRTWGPKMIFEIWVWKLILKFERISSLRRSEAAPFGKDNRLTWYFLAYGLPPQRRAFVRNTLNQSFFKKSRNRPLPGSFPARRKPWKRCPLPIPVHGDGRAARSSSWSSNRVLGFPNMALSICARR